MTERIYSAGELAEVAAALRREGAVAAVEALAAGEATPVLCLDDPLDQGHVA